MTKAREAGCFPRSARVAMLFPAINTVRDQHGFAGLLGADRLGTFIGLQIA